MSTTNDTTHSTPNPDDVREAIQLTEFHTSVQPEPSGTDCPNDAPTFQLVVTFTSFDARTSQFCHELLGKAITANANQVIVWINEQLKLHEGGPGEPSFV